MCVVDYSQQWPLAFDNEVANHKWAEVSALAHDIETKAHKYCCSELAGTFKMSVAMVRRWLADGPAGGVR